MQMPGQLLRHMTTAGSEVKCTDNYALSKINKVLILTDGIGTRVLCIFHMLQDILLLAESYSPHRNQQCKC